MTKMEAAFQAQRVGMPPKFSALLSDADVAALRDHLPERFACKDWHLTYSTELHGYNLHTAYRQCKGRSVM